MGPSDIALLRLDSQHVAGNEFKSPKSIVAWMGAMQAQDFPMARWGIGARLPGSTDRLVTAAIDRGDILRTHLLRPTWHFVTPEDIHWLLDLTAPQIVSGQRSRDRTLELTDTVYSKSNHTIEKALTAQGQLSREELVLALNQAGIATNQNRAAHLLMRAELEKIICSCAILRGKPTYALLAERVPKQVVKTNEEALAELAQRYLTSRSPATLQDFTWWSGLPVKDARQALEMVKQGFDAQEVHGTTYWLAEQHAAPATGRHTAILLPTYDEFIISYADRTPSIPRELEQHMKEISDRGIFWPIVVLDGQVIGTWKRTINKDRLLVEAQLFSPDGAPTRTFIEQAAGEYAAFWEAELDFTLS